MSEAQEQQERERENTNPIGGVTPRPFAKRLRLSVWLVSDEAKLITINDDIDSSDTHTNSTSEEALAFLPISTRTSQ